MMQPAQEAASDRRLDIKLSFRCNNRCVFCVQGDKRDTEPCRSPENVHQMLTEKRKTCDSVVFTGGEVSLREDLPAQVRHAKALGYRSIQIQTNGRRMSYAPYLDALIEAGATELAPALHGANAQTHDELVQAKGAFRQTVKAIRLAQKRGLPVVLNSVIVQSNVAQLPAMVRLFIQLGVRQSQFAFVHALGTAAQRFDTVVPRYRDVMPYLREALLLGERAGLTMMAEAVPLCQMGDLRRFVSEDVMPETTIVDSKLTIESYADWRHAEGKAHGPPCTDCALRQACEGPWCEYPAAFGWDEFVPVT
ncbi:MAG: radical SAM protein [Myxococcales bacterium]|nr:radical SAM protein [Myxococcales bacterium]